MNEQRLKKLLEIIGGFHKTPPKNEDALWDQLLNNACAMLGCSAGTFFEADDKMRVLTVKKCVGEHAELLSNLSFGYQGLCGWCAENKKPVISNDVKVDPRFTPKVDIATGFNTKSALCVPVVHAEELYGVLELINPFADGFTLEDLEFTAHLCAYISVFAKALKLEHTIKQLTHRQENILQNLSGGFIGADLNGNILFVNPRARQISAIGEIDFIGKPLTELSAVCRQAVGIIQETLATKNILRRQEFTCLINGATRRIGYSTLLIQDVNGKTAGAGLTFQDITEAAG